MNLLYTQGTLAEQVAACNVRKTIPTKGSVFFMDDHAVASIFSTPFFPRR